MAFVRDIAQIAQIAIDSDPTSEEFVSTATSASDPSFSAIRRAADRLCNEFPEIALHDAESDLVRRIDNGRSLEDAESEARLALTRAEEFASAPAPIAIPDLLPVPALNMEMFPSSLREWVIDEAARLSCPVDFVAVSALCGLAIVIGTQVGVKPKAQDDFFLYGNLYALIVADSGSKKTDAMERGLRFVDEIEKEKREEFEGRSAQIAAEVADRRLESEVIEKQLKDLHNGKLKDSDSAIVDKAVLRDRLAELNSFKPPTPERLLIMDVTVEKAGILLNENPRGLGIIQDEISPLFDSFKYKEKERDRRFYLKAANGTGTEIIDRVSRASLLIKNLCITLVGGVQPSRIASLVETSVAKDGDDGLLARFGATVFPDPLAEYRYVDTAPKGVNAARRVFRKLYNLDCSRFNRLTKEGGERYYLNFSDDAQRFFIEWLTALENEKRQVGTNGTEIPVAHISKFAGLMPKLALIFQLVDIVSGEEPDSTSISLKNAQYAAEWVSFFKAHAARLYSRSTVPEFRAAKTILQKIKAGKLPAIFSARELYRKHWGGLSKPSDANAALEVLVDYHWLTTISIPAGNKLITKYVFSHFDVLEKGAISANAVRGEEDAEAEAIILEGCKAL